MTKQKLKNIFEYSLPILALLTVDLLIIFAIVKAGLCIVNFIMKG